MGEITVGTGDGTIRPDWHPIAEREFAGPIESALVPLAVEPETRDQKPETDFRMVTISLTKHEWETLTKRLREHNAEHVNNQIQAGRLFWQIVAAIEARCQVPDSKD